MGVGEVRAGEEDVEDCTTSSTRRMIVYETIILGKAALVVTTLAIEPRMIAEELATLLFLGSLAISAPFTSRKLIFSFESTERVCLWFTLL